MTPRAETAGGSTTSNTVTLRNVMIAIIALALVGGGIFTWLGSSRKK
jgi:hypothetical protein